MADQPSRVPIPGSERPASAHAPVGASDPAEVTTVTVYVRVSGGEPPPGRLSREEFAAAYGASPTDVDAIRAFAQAHQLTPGDVDLARGSVQLTGTLGALSAAFGTTLTVHKDPDGVEYRARQGSLSVPSELVDVVTGVFGLDERPQARAQFRPRADARSQYTPPQVAAAYTFPTGLTGSGECIALIELGGGFRQADLSAYFAQLGVVEPSVVAVAVDGGSNSPGSPDGPDGEVMLDIEVSGSIAPGATIAVYFAPNTDQGFIDAVTTAVHDATHRPSVVSISWGSAESTWTAQAMNVMEQAFTAAAAMGVTVTVAAGDNGSTDGATDGLQHVDFPASAPHALGCGGTHLDITGGAIASESRGMTDPGTVPAEAGSATSSRCPTTSAAHRSLRQPTREAGSVGECPTSAAMPIPTPGTRFALTVRRSQLGGPARWRRFGRASSRSSIKASGDRSVSSNPSCTHRPAPAPSMTS